MKIETKEVLWTASFGFFALSIWLVIAIGSVVLTGCGGGEGDVYTNVYEAPESCVPGHMTQCPCSDGQLGHQTCSEDGKSYGECGCPAETTPGQDAGAEADAAETNCGPGQPVGHVVGTNCCPDGTTGYTVCQPSGAYEGCYGCQQADAGGDTATDANTEPLVSYTFKGPTMEQNADPGDEGIILLYVDVEAYGHIEIRRMPINFMAAAGYKLFNSGTQYLQNLRVVDLDTQAALMGPRDLPAMVGPNGENSACVEQCIIEFNHAFIMNQGDVRHLGIQVKLSDTEIQPGDFFGGQYTAELRFNQGDVYELNANMPVPLSRVVYPTEIKGAWTNISVPFQNQLDVQLSPTTPPEDIAVTGLSDLVPFTTYTVANSSNQPVSFDRVGLNAVKSNGFGAQASLNCLYGVIGDVWLSSCDIDQIGVTLITVDAPETSIILQAGEQVELKIYARLNPVQPGSIPGDLPRSGDYVRIELQSVMMDATPLYLATSMYGAPTPGNFMILRKTKPIVLMQPLADTHLMSGYRELYRVQIGSDAAGPVAVKQIMLDIEKTSGVMLGQLRVFEGLAALPLDQYTITDAQFGANVRDSIVPTNEDTVAVTFSSELAVTGAGKILSVYGQVQLSGQNNYVKVSHSNTSSLFMAETGYLLNNTAFTYPVSWTMSPDVYHVDDGPLGVAPGDFLWSDVSEVPHNPAIESGGGSKDWTNGHLVLDLTGSATLTQ